jgi:uncharacterized protein DUF4082
MESRPRAAPMRRSPLPIILLGLSLVHITLSPSSAAAGITSVVQARSVSRTSPVTSLTVSYTSPTTPGHALIVIASDAAVGGDSTMTLADADGNTWTRADRSSPIGPMVHTDVGGILSHKYIWWVPSCTCTNTGGNTRITVSQTAAKPLWTLILEVAYTGGVFDLNRAYDADDPDNNQLPDAGNILVDDNNTLIVSAVTASNVYTAPSGFSEIGATLFPGTAYEDGAYRLVATAGNYSAAWTGGPSGPWEAAVVTFSVRAPGTPGPPASYGFAFRGNAWAVRDANDTFSITGESYPTTYTNRNGNTITAGFIQSGLPDVAGRGSGPYTADLNNNTVVDHRLIGFNGYFDNTSPFAFKVTGIPPGTYNVDLAIGTSGPFAASVVPLVDIYDGDSAPALPDGTSYVLHVHSSTGLSNGQYRDATSSIVTLANSDFWNGTPTTITLTSGTMTIWFPARYDIGGSGDQPPGLGYYDGSTLYPYYNEHILLAYLRLTPVTAVGSLWTAAATPAVADWPDPNPVELGVRFLSNVAGSITALRFYKSPGSAGPHIGHLWTATGTLLATVTFANETASGWQQASLAAPVPINANTPYVASYFAPSGQYPVTYNGFAPAGVSAPPLTAPATPTNGLYTYAGDQFPNGATGTNYWVDVVFATAPPPPPPPPSPTCPCSLWTPAATPAVVDWPDPNPVELGVRFLSDTAGSITALRFYKSPGSAGPHIGHLWTATGTLLATVTFANETASGWQQASLAAPVPINANTPYVASYFAPSGQYPLTYNGFAPAGVSAPPLTAGATPTNGLYTYAGDHFPNGATGTNYWVDVVFTTTADPPPTCPCSLWTPATTPAVVDWPDPNPVELGVRFLSDTAGSITALRFYKSPGSAGPHIGHLWTATGTLLATVTFANETASGWQQASLAAPVPINANTPYVASYFAPRGQYPLTYNGFAPAGVSAPPLTAPATPTNGLYTYAGDHFPNGATGTNYWVDVVFSTP